MDIDIAGRVIVVTGAARGIGRTLALGLAAEGVRVAVLARERKQAQLVADEIGEIAGAPPALALEADDGIRTVALAPGLTDTPGMRAIVGEEYIARVAGQYPGGRVGQPEDIVAPTTFLCSDAASHLSGTVITVRPPVYR